MHHLGLSILEIRSLIEKAFQPDHCTCECHDGKTLSIDLTRHADPTSTLHLSGIPLGDLHSFRAVADLIARARHALACVPAKHPPADCASAAGLVDLQQHTAGRPSRYAGR
ncbi:DUF1652 domain-containing protein [Pseudomonas mucidolens]|uniref:DUF1652 domain-containing protein n=1 Tax=Pseudomonas mucidolens TaxID=46679 RepID=UPI0030D86B5F